MQKPNHLKPNNLKPKFLKNINSKPKQLLAQIKTLNILPIQPKPLWPNKISKPNYPNPTAKTVNPNPKTFTGLSAQIPMTQSLNTTKSRGPTT